jgi:hypothetical protein
MIASCCTYERQEALDLAGLCAPSGSVRGYAVVWRRWVRAVWRRPAQGVRTAAARGAAGAYQDDEVLGAGDAGGGGCAGASSRHWWSGG